MRHLQEILKLGPLRWLAAVGWTLLLTLLLLQPEADPVIDLGLPQGDSSLQREIFFSALHLLAFALTCVAWFRALAGAFAARTSLIIAVLIALALGILTESLQTLTLDRHASWIDLLANAAGTLAAARLIWRRYL